MDVRPQFLQPFLVRNSKPLLLIDDKQSQRLESYGLRQKCVCSDDDIDTTIPNSGTNLFRLISWYEA